MSLLLKKIINNLTKTIFIVFLILPLGCSSSIKFGREENNSSVSSIDMHVRVLLEENIHTVLMKIDEPVFVKNSGLKIVALVNKGNSLSIKEKGNELSLSVADKNYISGSFLITPKSDRGSITYNDIKTRGGLKIIRTGNSIDVINLLSLEEYLKGVITYEMPTGVGDNYFEALKSFAVCARTFTLMKLNENKQYFDVYPDTRNQVYGGIERENALSSRAVDETKGMILSYDGKPCTIYYSAACGGHTEKVQNVFSSEAIPYLQGVKDGDPPYCSIANNFNWVERYPEKVFINRLIEAGLINESDYSIYDIKVKDRFNSGRVEDLSISLRSRAGERKEITLHGNSIRSIIRTADNQGVLRSTMFDIHYDITGDVIISGTGNGHGVGYCQWGAIYQSLHGKDYLNILEHYFPGTSITRLYD